MRRPSLCVLTPWILAASMLLAACGDVTVEPIAQATVPDAATDTPSDAATVTMTASPQPAESQSASAAPSEAPTSAATEVPDVCAGREDEAFIEVLAPTDGTVVSAGALTLEGCGNTFEATYVWRVTLDDGSEAGSGFGTMTCGTGCVGTFSEVVSVTGSGPATLTVFEESAEDGSEIHVTTVTITLS